MKRVFRVAVLGMSFLSLHGMAAASAQKTPPPVGPARVVATVTALDGTVRIVGVDVELLSLDRNLVLARTTTDGTGQATFADVPAGRYVLKATRAGFAPAESPPLTVRAGDTAQVLLEIHATFDVPPVEVRAPASATESLQPVSTSDMLAGSVLEIAPLEGDDFQSLLPLLPGVVRGPDGRLRMKGGQPTQGALQVSSASLVDPSSGDFSLELPGQSVESVELLANPFAAEHGRFSTSLVEIRTRRGGNTWETSVGNLVPRIRNGFRVRGFEPRFSVRGPLWPNRLFVAQDFQFRYVADPVRSLPGEPEIGLKSFDSFTRVDAVLSARHALTGVVVLFPRKITHLTMNTFRPPEATPEFTQHGMALGAQDRFAISSSMVLESTLAVRGFEVEVNGAGGGPMIYTPETEGGSFFNDQEREVSSVQWIEALSIALDTGHGSHLFKFGLDLQDSSYDGSSVSRPVEVFRADGSLAERVAWDAPTLQSVSAAELALFVQDRWRIGQRVTVEAGLRMDREDVIERVNWSPRAGVSIAVLPEGRGILRGGVGQFQQRTPLNVGAFGTFEPRVVTRFTSAGTPEATTRYINVAAPDLRTPQAVAANVEWNQRFGRSVLLKANFLRRAGSHEYIVVPDPVRGELHLMSSGTSNYRELEVTGRYLGGDRRDLTLSYVWSRSRADLNNYDQFYGNVRNPLVRSNEHNLVATDVPHRFLLRGTIGLPGGWDLAPVAEIRSGFPWSAVNEFQDFVGPRNRAGRLPRVHTLDFSLSRNWRIMKRRFRAGVKVYNVFGASAERDVQHNVESPDFGRFYNPLTRSIGVMFGRP